MPCVGRTADGRFVTVRRSRTGHCHKCSRRTTKLCDGGFELAGERVFGITCDREMCDEHAHHVGPGCDLCDDHFEEQAREPRP